jgi:hypothetical protein
MGESKDPRSFSSEGSFQPGCKIAHAAARFLAFFAFPLNFFMFALGIDVKILSITALLTS